MKLRKHRQRRVISEPINHYEQIDTSAEQRYLNNKARLYMLSFRESVVRFFGEENVRDSRKVAHYFGFSHICSDCNVFDENPTMYKEKILRFLDKEFDTLQTLQKRGDFGHYKLFEKNLNMLQKSLGLNDVEIAIIELVALAGETPMFKGFLRNFRDFARTPKQATIALSKMLGFSTREVSTAMRRNGILVQTQILCYDRDDLGRMLEGFYDEEISEILFGVENDRTQIVGRFAVPCDEDTLLSPEDYSHIKEFSLIQEYLAFTKANAKKGVNILLYGVPGTGKTELAKLLAKNINVKLYKVRTKDKYGDEIDGAKRLGSYMLAQRFLDSDKNLLLYDEAEDIFNDFGRRFHYKAFFNEVFENNPLPTIWITNNIRVVDDALIRRFDFVVNIGIPKRRVRRVMLDKICGTKLDKKTRKLAQKSLNLAPALINRANEVSSVLQGDFSKNFLMLVNNTLKAQGHAPIKKSKKSKDSTIALPKSYSTDFINADCDISHIAEGLSANPNARICLYGLSGTGKSAYAQFIAKTLKRPCIIKAVSDLESMWVGETEKNIAKAFKEARAKKAVLVFDEVDSFLRERKLAVRSWETTKVNEMLLQMEKFDGIFIATTNLMDNIDKAALRRFDLKVEFMALDCAQRVNLFKKECAILGLKCESNARDLIARLDCLTPGDFAAVRRGHKFNPIKNARDFYARLCDEVKVKDMESMGTKAGFLA
ncbi:AAA family ATPase [Helicobacter sp. 23-1046]